MAQPKFELVEDEPAPQPTPDRAAAIGALLLGLKALSQRTIAAIADLFTLLTLASAFWLWNSIRDPNPYQIVSLTIYAIFILAANWIVRRK